MEPQYNKTLYKEPRGITKDNFLPEVETILASILRKYFGNPLALR